jgi:sec-independent protein translocase protein TatC
MKGPDELKKGENPGGEWEDHLDELRRRVISVLVVFSAASAAAFAFSEKIAAFLMNPVAGLGVKLYTFAPAEKFMAYLHLAVWTGAVFSAPFFLLQAGVFIWPALRNGERRYALTALLVVPALFAAGAAMAYRFLASAVLGFFLSFGASDAIEPLWGLREYLGMLSGMMVVSGLLLQTPLVMLFLFAAGIAAPEEAARFRPHIVILIFFAAAVCTPPDVISQLALGIPLYLLFEMTLLLGRLIVKKR